MNADIFGKIIIDFGIPLICIGGAITLLILITKKDGKTTRD